MWAGKYPGKGDYSRDCSPAVGDAECGVCIYVGPVKMVPCLYSADDEPQAFRDCLCSE